MKHLLSLCLLLAFSLCAPQLLAQKLNIKGAVADSAAKPLEFATVMLLNAKDSSLATFTRSGEGGAFELKNLNPANYLLKITYTGYVSFTRSIAAQSGDLNLGTLTMKVLTKQLAEVTVQAEKAPVTIKKDTVEFNAESFKTSKPNAAVEDLLKRLPGVQVERDGSIKVQGENVQRITVNGKEFFGRDPKVATRNLPATAVDKVQVFDRLSDQSQFTGIDDGQREKTINLELKEKYRNGGFGNFQAGAGVDATNAARYDTRASYNRFSKATQLSLLGMGNNVNQQGFSIQDYLNFSSQGQGMGGGGGMRVVINNGGGGGSAPPINSGERQNGIMTNWAGGANLNHVFNKKTEVNGSYLFNNLNHQLNQDTRQQNFLPTGTFSTLQNSNQRNENNNHRLNITLDHKIDSANSIRLTSQFNQSQTRLSTLSNSSTFNGQNQLQNSNERNNLSTGTSLSWNNDLLLRHRFKKRGRTISANLTFNMSQSDRNSSLTAVNKFYNTQSTEPFRTDNIRQDQTRTSNNYTYGANLSYTEPLGKRKFLELNYNLRNNLSKVDQQVFDLRDGERVPNQNLTNKFDNNFMFQRAGANFRMNQKKYNFSVGAALQSSDLNGELVLRQTSVNKQFTNLLPNARLNVDFSQSKRLNFNYDTDVNAPSITQLQPVVDNTDPLNIYVGNPDLKPEYSHRARLNFFTFDPIKFVNFFAAINGTYTQNRIVNSQVVDARFARTTRPVNTRDFMSLNGNLNLGFPINTLLSRFNIGTRLGANRSINLLNNVESYARQYTYAGNVRYTFRYEEAIDISLAADWSQQNTVFDVNQAQNQNFFNQTYTAEANFSPLKNLRLNTDLDYYIYSSQTTNFRQEIPVWNFSVSTFVLKAQSGELRFSVNNILDKSLGVTQQASLNALEQTVVNNLGRYYMLTFVYSLNKALNPMGGGGGRRGMMMRMGQ